MTNGEKGYTLLIAIIAVTILSISLLAARLVWETEIARDLEDEMMFRARQYVRAIEQYKIKNNNTYPTNLRILFGKKFLRKLYKDPLSDDGNWDVVMESVTAGKKKLMVVPAEAVQGYLARARIIGVCCTSLDVGFREYRGKKKYNEWAFYMGDDPSKEMPKLIFVSK